MKKLAVLAAIALASLNLNPSETQAKIANGAVQFNNHHYIVVNANSATWWDANEFCKTKGGHLVTITSTSEQNFVKKLIRQSGSKNNYWIGGYKDSSNTWRWVTGENFIFTSWSSGEPNNFQNQENCLAMYGDVNSQFGDWNDMRGDGFSREGDTFFGANNFGFICEWDY